jgi:carbamoyltransferase
MNYIGISTGFHDAAMAVITDQGDIAFAAHSERYSMIKHDKTLSLDLIKDVLTHTQGVYQLHYYERPWLRWLRGLRTGQRRPSTKTQDVLGEAQWHMLGRRLLHTHGHHLSHAAAQFQTSPYDEATVVVIDAIGEFDTASIWHAHYDANGFAQYKKLWSQTYPDSIGLFYTAMTQRVGLKPLDEEYILMGMAAYGNTKLEPVITHDLVASIARTEFKQNLHTGVNPGYLDGADSFDLAAATQSIAEQYIGAVMARALTLNPSKNLCYGGGVALNCLANRLLGEYYENIWIMPNPGDAGSSLGAACLGYGRRVNWHSASLGHVIPGAYPVSDIMAQLLAKSIVGVASGPAEYGPRALGNRSLLADPRGTEIKEKVNDIKRRQQFRPFAPVVMEEFADSYFDMPRGWHNSRYMQSVARCRHPELFPAIIHRDGTSRVQTVPQDGSGIRQLLEAWYAATGCPMLLNTSLNVRGEPMVNNRDDADRFENLYGVKVCS